MSHQSISPLTLFRPGGGGMPPPLSFFGNYSETVQFSILKFSDFSQIRVSDIFGLIHFFVSFSVWAVEGHFFAHISEIWPKNGDFQNFWKIFKPFSAEINMLTSNLWNYNKNWEKIFFLTFLVYLRTIFRKFWKKFWNFFFQVGCLFLLNWRWGIQILQKFLKKIIFSDFSTHFRLFLAFFTWKSQISTWSRA